MRVDVGKEGIFIGMENEVFREKCSALLDGELEIDETNKVLDESKYKNLIEVIGTYLKIRDVLREKSDFLNPSRDLISKVRQSLESEICISIELDNHDSLEESLFYNVEI